MSQRPSGEIGSLGEPDQPRARARETRRTWRRQRQPVANDDLQPPPGSAPDRHWVAVPGGAFTLVRPLDDPIGARRAHRSLFGLHDVRGSRSGRRPPGVVHRRAMSGEPGRGARLDDLCTHAPRLTSLSPQRLSGVIRMSPPSARPRPAAGGPHLGPPAAGPAATPGGRRRHASRGRYVRARPSAPGQRELCSASPLRPLVQRHDQLAAGADQHPHATMAARMAATVPWDQNSPSPFPTCLRIVARNSAAEPTLGRPIVMAVLIQRCTAVNGDRCAACRAERTTENTAVRRRPRPKRRRTTGPRRTRGRAAPGTRTPDGDASDHER